MTDRDDDDRQMGSLDDVNELHRKHAELHGRHVELDKRLTDQESNLVGQETRLFHVLSNLVRSFTKTGYESQRVEAASAAVHWFLQARKIRSVLFAGGGIIAIATLASTFLSLQQIEVQNDVMLRQAEAEHYLSLTQIVLDERAKLDEDIRPISEIPNYRPDTNSFDDFRTANLVMQDLIPLHLANRREIGEIWNELDALLKNEDIEGAHRLIASTLKGLPRLVGTLEEMHAELSPAVGQGQRSWLGMNEATLVLTTQGSTTLFTLSQMLADFDRNGLEEVSQELEEVENDSQRYATNAKGALLAWLVNANVFRKIERKLDLSNASLAAFIANPGIMRNLTLDRISLGNGVLNMSNISKVEMSAADIDSLEIVNSSIINTEISGEINSLTINRSFVDRLHLRGNVSGLSIKNSYVTNLRISDANTDWLEVGGVAFGRDVAFKDSRIGEAAFTFVSFGEENEALFLDSELHNVRMLYTDITPAQICSAKTVSNLELTGSYEFVPTSDDCSVTCVTQILQEGVPGMICNAEEFTR